MDEVCRRDAQFQGPDRIPAVPSQSPYTFFISTSGPSGPSMFYLLESLNTRPVSYLNSIRAVSALYAKSIPADSSHSNP